MQNSTLDAHALTGFLPRSPPSRRSCLLTEIESPLLLFTGVGETESGIALLRFGDEVTSELLLSSVVFHLLLLLCFAGYHTRVVNDQAFKIDCTQYVSSHLYLSSSLQFSSTFRLRRIIWLVDFPLANEHVVAFFGEPENRRALAGGSLGSLIESQMVQELKDVSRRVLKVRSTEIKSRPGFRNLTLIPSSFLPTEPSRSAHHRSSSLPSLQLARSASLCKPVSTLPDSLDLHRLLTLVLSYFRQLHNLRRHFAAPVSVSEPASLHPCGDIELDFGPSIELAVSKDISERFYDPALGESSLQEGVKTFVELPLPQSWRKREGGNVRKDPRLQTRSREGGRRASSLLRRSEGCVAFRSVLHSFASSFPFFSFPFPFRFLFLRLRFLRPEIDASSP